MPSFTIRYSFIWDFMLWEPGTTSSIFKEPLPFKISLLHAACYASIGLLYSCCIASLRYFLAPCSFLLIFCSLALPFAWCFRHCCTFLLLCICCCFAALTSFIARLCRYATLALTFSYRSQYSRAGNVLAANSHARCCPILLFRCCFAGLWMLFVKSLLVMPAHNACCSRYLHSTASLILLIRSLAIACCSACCAAFALLFV